MPKYKVLRFDAPPHPSPNSTFHLTARIKKSIVYVRLYYVYIFFVSLEVLPEECWSNRWCHRCCQQFDGRVTLHSRLKWNNHHRTKQHIFFGACEATFEKTPNRSNFLPLTSYSLPTVCDAPEVSQSKKKKATKRYCLVMPEHFQRKHYHACMRNFRKWSIKRRIAVEWGGGRRGKLARRCNRIRYQC